MVWLDAALLLVCSRAMGAKKSIPLRGLRIFADQAAETIAFYDPSRCAGPVPLEYSIGWVTCTVVNMMDVAMVGLPVGCQNPATALTRASTQPARIC
jgi:hypothetical protein